EQHAADDAEDRGVDADAERQRDDDGEGEPFGAAKRTQGEAEVGKKGHRSFLNPMSILPVRNRHSATPSRPTQSRWTRRPSTRSQPTQSQATWRSRSSRVLRRRACAVNGFWRTWISARFPATPCRRSL